MLNRTFGVFGSVYQAQQSQPRLKAEGKKYTMVGGYA